MKQRVRRMLSVRFASATSTTSTSSSSASSMMSPEMVELSSLSSGIVSDDDMCNNNNSNSPHNNTTTTNNNNNNSDSEEDNDEAENDPYADVRDILDTLCALEHRNRHHHHNNNNRNNSTTTTTTTTNKEPIPAWVTVTGYLAVCILLWVGHVLDFCSMWTGMGRWTRKKTTNKETKEKHQPPKQEHQQSSSSQPPPPPLLGQWESFYVRRVYTRVSDCFNRPIASSPGVHLQVYERWSTNRRKTMQLASIDVDDNGAYSDRNDIVPTQTHLTRPCLNLGSYNYLGFADDWNQTCGTPVHQAVQNWTLATGGSLQQYGRTHIHAQLEQTVAEFLQVPDALVLTMGFNTNATVIPALVKDGDLIISDALNHTSIVTGARASGAAIRVFRHDDMPHLEEILKQAIIMGRPRTRRPWNKILIIVEGVYSMEGEYCDLKSVVRLAKQYGAYVYLDEAHSIGAMGITGRGCAEHNGVEPSEIDVLMGTFTKSFAGMGGYIAGSRTMIRHLRTTCAASTVHNAMSPIVCQQVLTALQIIMGKDGTNIGKIKLQALRDNSNYFRMRLEEMGLNVLGQYDSPVIPVMLHHLPKVGSFSRECLKRNLAVVVVGPPAVPLLESRVRFCMSAAHTREQLDHALSVIEEIVDICAIRYRTPKSYATMFL